MSPPVEPAAPARGAIVERVEASVHEVFASIQGEGAFAGEAQVFVRLQGCPLRCRYCDTPGSWGLAPSARIAGTGGHARREPARATPFQVACWIAEVEPGTPRTVSVTGGEPLLWPDFVRGLATFLGPRRLHLETAGAHLRALEAVLDSVDHVSLDLKLGEDLDPPVAGGELARDEALPASPDDWAGVRRAALRLLAGRDACGKLVVTADSDAASFEPLFDDVARLAPGLPLYLAPATPVREARAPSAERVLEVLEAARERELAARVVPQLHRVMGIP